MSELHRSESPAALYEASARALHAVRMMRISATLARAAEDDRHARILARYVYLHCFNACEWLTRWRELLQTEGDAVQRRRGSASTTVDQLKSAFKKHRQIRYKLAAKRQSSKTDRGADLRETRRLWKSITASGVTRLCDLAETAAVELAGHPLLQIASAPGAESGVHAALRAVQLDPTWSHLDATSYFMGEPHRVEIITGGQLGARVTQVNDYAEHLDVLYALRDFARGRSEIALALRSAWINEVAELVRTALGTSAGSLATMLGQHRNGDTPGFTDLLGPLRDDVLGDPFIAYVTETRDIAVAHLQPEGDFAGLLERIIAIEPDDLFHVANVLLQRLDEAARHHLDLGLLLLGPHRLHALASNSHVRESMTTNVDYATTFNSPYGATVGNINGVSGAAYLAGVVSSRARRERTRWPTTLSTS